MALLYFVFFLFFFAALLAAALYPFYRLTERLRVKHPELWHGFGPFTLKELSEKEQKRKNLIRFMSRCHEDEALTAKDPELIKSAKMCREIYVLTSKSFQRQLSLIILLGLLAYMLTGAVMRALFS